MRIGFIAFILMLASPAFSDDVAKARAHFEKGTTLYDLQQFAEAAREYELAYAAKNDPALLFNIAQAYRAASEYGKAIGAYKAYLRRNPTSSNRAEVEARIADLQKLLDEQKKAQDRPPSNIEPLEKPANDKPPEAIVDKPAQPAIVAASVGPPPTIKRPLVIAGIAIIAVGVAALAAGGGLYAGAQSAYDEIQNPAPGAAFSPATQDRMNTFQSASFAMFGLGGAAAITGIALVAVGAKRTPLASRAHVLPVLGPNHAGLIANVRF